MRRLLPWMVLILLCAARVSAAEPVDKVVRDTWDAAYLEGGKVGFAHTVVREIERDGQTMFRTTIDLDLTFKRGNATVRLRAQSGCDETADGKILAIAQRLFLDKNQELLFTGKVEGDQIHLRTNDLSLDKKIPWNDKVVSIRRQELIYKEAKVKPGDTLVFPTFEPTIASIATIRAAVKDEEEVEVLGKKRKLLRVEGVYDKIQAANGKVQLPPTVWWLDRDWNVVRMQLELPGLGQLFLHRTTKEVALAAGPPPKANDVDIIRKNLVPLNRTLDRAPATNLVVYKVSYSGDDNLGTLFAQDERQTVRNVKGKTCEVVVQAVRSPKPNDKAAEPGKEFLESCHFINSDDGRVKDLASRIVGTETDPWKKGQLIERWLRENMKYDNSIGFCPADRVAIDPKGDCRHAGLLGAALARAAGVPSRTAIGLVYVLDPQRKPCLGFHMWFEVWVKGQWLALDGTQGLGSVGADHLKISDSSWADTQSLLPLLPLTGVIGKIEVEIIKAE
jgi:hypothetical protein